MEEYDFEDNLTFEMESEIYGSDFKSEMDDYGEEEYYQKQIAEHERQIKEDELKLCRKWIKINRKKLADFNDKKSN